MPFIQKYPHHIATAILILFFGVSLSISSQDSTIMDEQAHIPAGYSYVRYGDMRLNPEHPPLLKDLAGIPILFLNPIFPTNAPEWITGINEQWVMGDKLLHQEGNDAQAITFWARLPILILSVVLGIVLYLWVSEWLGIGAGLFALTLYAFDPNILGHNHFVTTDLGIAAFTFFAVITFIRWVKSPTMHNTLLFGLFLGLAQLTKFSGVILFPLFFLLTIIYALSRNKRGASEGEPSTPWQLIWGYAWRYAIAVIICFIAIEILYFFNTLNMPAEKISIIADASFKANTTAAHIAKATIDWMAAKPILKPLAEYFLGVFMVFARVAGGNTYYFFGTVTNHATPLYFPAVFLLKETLPLLILSLFSLIYVIIRLTAAIRTRTQSIGLWMAQYIEHNISQVTMLSFVVFYAYLSITSNLNIGFRHLFPILPFIYILITKIVWDAYHSHSERHSSVNQMLAKIFTGIFIFWIVAIPVISYPSYMSYFNEAAGGHANGYKYVTDSNYDWGQDLKRLKIWVDQYNQCARKINSFPSHICNRLTLNNQVLPTTTPIDTLRIDYFGGSSPQYWFGSMFKPWHGELAPEAGWYAISAGFYQESSHKTQTAGEWSYRWLDKYPMVARAGDSIFIFYVPEVR